MKNVDGGSVASHNLFWGNTTDAIGSIVQASIVANPLLDANYGLQASSPAIDAGVAHFEWNGEVLMDQPSGAYEGSAPDVGWKEASSGSGGGAPPVMTSVGITPSSPGTNALLTANATATDPEGDQISFSYQWIKNSVNLAGATTKTLDLSVAGNGDKGDQIAVTVTASDGSGDSSPMTSSAATVANTNPTFNQDLSDRSNAEGDAIAFSASASDPDEDPLTYGATGLPPGLTIDVGSGLISGSIASGAAGSSPYTVAVTVGDGATVDATDMFTWVVAAPGSTIVERPVVASKDDAEESVGGAVNLNSADLELVLDGARGDQTVGMRFTGVTVPPGAAITDAYVQFQVDRATSVATSLTIHGQAADNAATFAKTTQNISSRPRTAQSVPWDPVPWSTIGTAGLDQRTPDLSSVVQEIVDRPGWANGNAMVIIVIGSGKRVAESFDGGAPPILHIEYGGGSPQNLAPVADAGPDQQVTLPDTATMAGTASDDGLPGGTLSTTWSQVSGPGTASFTAPSSLSTMVSFSEPGIYVLRLTANDGALQTSDDITVTVNGASGSTNLVGNPGFEDNTNGWNVSGSDVGVTLTRFGEGHSGGWSGRLSNEGTAPGMCKLNDQPNWVATTAAGTYSVGMWARADAPGATLTIRIREYAGSVLVDKQTASLGLSTSWQRVTLSYVTRSPGSNLDLQAWVPAAPVGTCFYADDVEMSAP
jgi:hypothetical protein